jgi:hypothetical protein
VAVSANGKVQKIGAPLGFWLDVLPGSPAPDAAADPACRINGLGWRRPP